MPRLLRQDLLCQLVRKRRLVLCLDYDGTIAPTAPSPEEALPPAEIRELMQALAGRPDRILLAVASGRRIEEVQALLALERPLAIIGMHGLEVMDWDGHHEITSPIVHCLSMLDKARTWLNSIAHSRPGLLVEDKSLALALHYRSANRDEAAAAIAGLRRLVHQEATELSILYGNCVAELVPRVAPDKGFALLSLLQRKGGAGSVPVYFSDDTNDEGAFYKVRRHGVTVLVGAERQSYAEYRLESRDNLAEVLAGMAETIRNSVF